MALCAGAVVEHEAVAVGGKYEGDVQRLGIFERLLHAVADAVVVVFRLDHRDRDVRLIVENEVGLLGLAARDQLAANDDPALGEIDLLANLQHLIPAGAFDGGQDELRADVAFGEASFVHADQRPVRSCMLHPLRFFKHIPRIASLISLARQLRATLARWLSRSQKRSPHMHLRIFL